MKFEFFSLVGGSWVVIVCSFLFAFFCLVSSFVQISEHCLHYSLLLLQSKVALFAFLFHPNLNTDQSQDNIIAANSADFNSIRQRFF